MPVVRTICLTLSLAVYSLAAIAQSRTNAQLDSGTLPVMFDSVRAVIKNDQVHIAWLNLTERDVSFYMIERSVDGKDFKPVYRQEPSHNFNAKAGYSFTDVNALPGNSYYRIRVTINTGRVVSSRILKAQMGYATPGFTVYPNPVMDDRFNITLAAVQKGTYTMDLLSFAGVRVKQISISLQGDGITQTVDLPAGLAPGTYIVSLKGDDYIASKLIVKK